MPTDLSPELFAVLATGARLFVAAVMALAAIHKLRNWLEFEGILGQYRILPPPLVTPVSRLVPFVELLAAAFLLIWPIIGVVLAAALLISYAGAIAVNLKRSRQHIDCGCGGESTPLSPAMVGRNLFMVLLVATTVLTQPGLGLSLTGITLSGAFAVGLGAIYACYNQLLANAGIYRRLWLGERVG